MIKRLIKILLKSLLWTIVSVVVLVGLVLAFIQTPVFKDLLRDRVTAMVNDELNATLRIGSIGGNFFTRLVVEDGELRSAQDRSILVSFERLEVAYDLLAILDDRVVIEAIRLDKPYLNLVTDTTGVLNFSTIAKPSAPKPPKPVDSMATMLGGLAIRLEELALNDGTVALDFGAFRRTATGLTIRLHVAVDDHDQHIDLKQLSFALADASSPKADTLQVRNLSVQVDGRLFPRSLSEQAAHPEIVDTLSARIGGIRLVTDRTDFFVAGLVILPDSAHGVPLSYDMDLRAYPFHLDDIRGFADIGMSDLHKVELETHAKGDEAGVLLTDLSITTSAGELRGYAGVDYGEGPLGYKADLSFKGINIGAFADRSDLYANINGRVLADGIGTDPKTLRSNLNLTLRQSRFFGIDIENFEIDAHVTGGVAELSKFEGRTSAGQFNCQGQFNLSTEAYHLETRLRDINVADIIGDTSMQSSINLTLVYDGQGLNPEKSTGTVRLISDSSKILNRDLENLTVRGSQSHGKVKLDEITIATPLASFTASGSVGLDSSVDLSYSLATRDFSLLKRYIGVDTLLKDTLNLKLRFDGKITGNYDRMNTSGEVNLTNLVFSTIRMDSLRLTYYFDNILPGRLAGGADVKSIDSTIFGDIVLYTHHLDMAGTHVRDFTTSITKEKNRTSFEISANEDSLNAYANLKGSLVLENEKKGELFLDNLSLRIGGRTLKTREVMLVLGGDAVIDSSYEKWVENWQNKDPIDLAFDLEKNVFDIRSFNMDIGKGFISLFGKVDVSGDQNLDLKVKDLDLSRVNALIGSGQSVVEGLLNLNASLKGSFEKPIIIADWNISNGKASEFVYDNFLGNLQYLNRKLQINMTLNQNKDKTLTMGGYLPLDLTFKEVENRLTNRPMNFIVHSEGIDLRFLQAFFGKNLTLNRGEIKLDMKVSGNKEKPVIQGEMKIEDGQLTFPRSTLGQTFRNVRLFVRLTPEQVFLDTLMVQSGKDPNSLLLANGTVDLADVLKNFAFNNVDKIGYQFHLVFADFVPINTKSETSYLHTAKVTGEMDVAAPSLFNTMVKGDLQIRNSEIWVVDPTKAKVVTTARKGDKAAEKQASEFYKNLDMDLMISLPENSDNSIRSAEMTLSLFGEIGVTKPPGSEDFFIAGDVNTKKGGKYAYLNVAFTIDRGVITFSGEPGVNPNLDILAVKRFEYKDDDGTITPSEAQIKVSGKLLKPSIAITAVERGSGENLAGLSEPQDILSYLVLGVKTKDITKLGASQAGDFAKQVAINQILNVVANKAGLQKLEFVQGTAGESSKFEIAKRINEDLSVSYEGGLDVSSGRTVTLEYSADSLLKKIPVMRSWKKTIEFEYKQPSQDKTLQQEDIINILLYFRKDY